MKDSLCSLLTNKKFQIIFLVYSSLLTFLGRQLDRGITNFDGAYYAIKAREIFLSDSWWVVTWNGTARFFDNPPLPFWVTGLIYKIFGVSPLFLSAVVPAQLTDLSAPFVSSFCFWDDPFDRHRILVCSLAFS